MMDCVKPDTELTKEELLERLARSRPVELLPEPPSGHNRLVAVTLREPDTGIETVFGTAGDELVEDELVAH
jgi:hypothetical protein